MKMVGVLGSGMGARSEPRPPTQGFVYAVLSRGL